MNENSKAKFRKFMKSSATQSILSSLLCIIVGLFIGFIVLLFIEPSGAFQGIVSLIRSVFKFSNPKTAIKYFGNTLVKTAPLIMCALSILFCYKVGLFNIGASGQYTAGATIALYAALAWNMPWWVCLLLAVAAGAVLGTIVGLLKAYCNVNEVISGIMLNWIGLYCANMILVGVKEVSSPYTTPISYKNPGAILPSLGLGSLFNGNDKVTIAIPLSIIMAVVIMIILEKTKFGYELKATGFNRNAAKYSGMAEKRNIIVSLAIGGALAGMGAVFFYLTGYEQWETSVSSVPAMGFNGIAAAFLGGLNPIGTILSSYFIQHITDGGAYVDKSIYCSQISDLISSIIIYLCGFVMFVKLAINKKIVRDEEKEAAEKKAAENAEGGNK